jgi:2-hydroxy-6-oxonona-2,4-dienedioate hydrolase
MIALGSGPPLVMVPGIQGRWEWQRPALVALAERTRAVTFSLCGEPGTRCRLDHERGFDAHVGQLDRVLDHFGIEQTALCGVSYGGWVSLRYAAARPDRVSALVIVSAPGPRFRPDLRQMRYVRAPWLLFPLFVATTRARLRPEIVAAVPEKRERRRITRQQLRTMARAPITPGAMARRIRLALREDFASDCAKVKAPTLVVTGEKELDRIVPVGSTLEYVALIPGAVGVELAGTGHIGLITRPREWAGIVCDFVERVTAATPQLAS